MAIKQASLAGLSSKAHALVGVAAAVAAIWLAAVAPGASASGAQPSGARGGSSPAIAASRLSVNEKVQTSVVTHHGSTLLNERGSGSGTFACAMTLQVKITYTRGTLAMVCQTKVGRITGNGNASFFVAGQTATFTGTIAITQGTGRYAHMSGQLRVEGTVRRGTYQLHASISGSVSL